MKKQTRYKRKRVRGGAKKTIKNPLKDKKITFTLFVGDDGLYLQEPKVESAMFASNLKKGTKLTKGPEFKEQIETALTKLKNDYEVGDFDKVYSDKTSSAPSSSNNAAATEKGKNKGFSLFSKFGVGKKGVADGENVAVDNGQIVANGENGPHQTGDIDIGEEEQDANSLEGEEDASAVDNEDQIKKSNDAEKSKIIPDLGIRNLFKSNKNESGDAKKKSFNLGIKNGFNNYLNFGKEKPNATSAPE
jgi:hypothetical protein